MDALGPTAGQKGLTIEIVQSYSKTVIQSDTKNVSRSERNRSMGTEEAGSALPRMLWQAQEGQLKLIQAVRLSVVSSFASRALTAFAKASS